MSESMSKPWIREYLTNIAETHGAQLYNVSASSKKKKVQLTDLLTYQEDSYVWAWISDKDYKISVRISKDAVDRYKSVHGRGIVESRFFLVFVSEYRPMFSPRPLGPNTLGNTPISYISLEINYISSFGTGGYLFGSPQDLESDETMKEWVLGLRQDGGGGNVLKLRKQQEAVQEKNATIASASAASASAPPTLSLPLAPHNQGTTVDNDAKHKPERPQNFERTYTKRWRHVETDQWKFAVKPEVEARLIQAEHSIAEPFLEADSRFDCPREPSSHHTPNRTPSPTSLRRQGTPTDWSESGRGSPFAPDEASTSILVNEVPQHDGSKLLSTAHSPSDTDDHTTVCATFTSDNHSLRPPTPAQRTKRSPSRHSSPPRSSPEPPIHSPLSASEQLLCSSLPPPSSSMPLPSPSLSTVPIGIRKNIQRKVPHPGLVPPPDPTKYGPAQILVPNSDTSGTGSTQSCSQFQHLSQSQQHLCQPPSHSPSFPTSLVNGFRPSDVSTPGEEKPISAPRQTSKMLARSSPAHSDGDEGTTSADKECTTGEANAGGRTSESNTPKGDSFGGRKYDSGQETNGLQLTQEAARKEAKTQDTGKGDSNIHHPDNSLPVDKTGTLSTPKNGLPDHSLSRGLSATLVKHNPSPGDEDTDSIPAPAPTRPLKGFRSRSPMHSLFSDSWDERNVSSQVPADQTEENAREKEKSTSVPRHDPETWKAPSFMVKNKEKGKARAVENPGTRSVRVGKKRQRSVEPASLGPMPKRVKDVSRKARQAPPGPTTPGISGHIQSQGHGISATPNIHPNDRGSSSCTDPTEKATSLWMSEPKPRLANFLVDFKKINLGKRVPISRLDVDKDIKSNLLRTGRIRTLGEEAENNSSVYIARL